MSRTTLRLTLRAGERIFVNGAVLRAERKTTLELLNDATFLLEHHVMQPEETTSPLRQLYFVVQTMFVDPSAAREAALLYQRYLAAAKRTFTSRAILDGLAALEAQMEADRRLEALKTLRALFTAEDAILGPTSTPDAALAPETERVLAPAPQAA